MNTAIIPKVFVFTAILLSVTLISACGKTPPAQVPPTAAVSPTTPPTTLSPTASAAPMATLIPTHPPATATRKPSLKPTPELPTETPLSNGEVTWAEGLDIRQSEGIYTRGEWSPTADEMVFFLADQYDTTDMLLARFAAPDFRPQEIRAPAPKPKGQMWPCQYPGMLWSKNGQRLFFSGPVVNPSRDTLEPCSIWMVEHDGSSARLYLPEQSGRSFGPVVWLDDHTMLITGYREGLHVFDLLQGKTINWVKPHYFGISLNTRSYYVGTDDSPSMPQAYALGRREKPLDIVMQDGPDNMKYAKTPPPDPAYAWIRRFWSGHTILYDVLAGTNQALAYWFQDIGDETDPNNLKLIFVHKLVLWDIDQNTLTTLVPHGFWGKFSPDGRTLAYLTWVPAPLDAENRPIDPNSPDHLIPSDQLFPDDFYYTNTAAYLQLLDFNTGKVFLSVPVASLHDFSDDDFLHGGANFSPDGRYLSFLTNRKIFFDQKGWPEMVQPDSEAQNAGHLYVLDLKSHRLIWDQGDLAPVPGRGYEETPLEERLAQWSLKSDQFIFLDAQNNPVLVNLNTGVQKTISLSISGVPFIQWSASGKYVAIQVPDGNSWKIGFLTVP